MVISNNKWGLLTVMEHFSVSKSFNLKSLSMVQNLTVEPFDLAQIINNFPKVLQNKNNLIYAEMVKVLWYMFSHKLLRSTDNIPSFQSENDKSKR